jgi:muramoyltetrapeptide carboxypeptidase
MMRRLIPGVALAVVLSSGFGVDPADPPSPLLKPPPLRPGDTVVIVATSSPVSSGEVEEAAANLRRRGYQVKIAAGTLEKRGYLAGGDEARAAALNEALRDPEARLVLCARGGYGSPRILDRLDYQAIRRFPKAILGYSDVTSLLLAIEQRARLVTFHGPMAGKDFSGRGGLSPFAERHLLDLLGPASSESRGSAFADWGKDPPGASAEERRTIAPGSAEGPLLGGNLSSIAALMGTPYEIDARGAILFLEDVNEEPFRIDRMLNQLRLAGKLAGARGILLGAFTRCEPRSPRDSLSLEEVFADYFAGLGVPVLAGFPAGHLPEQAVLPLGVRVRLDATARTLSLLEPAVAEPVEAARGAPGEKAPGGQ